MCLFNTRKKAWKSITFGWEFLADRPLGLTQGRAEILGPMESDRELVALGHSRRQSL